MNTNWSTPKTNIIAALICLRQALISGFRARLVRLRNEDCDYPILTKNVDNDFRNYEFQIGHAASRDTIRQRQDLTDFQKHLSLNYVTCYGTPEAVEHYYSTGKLSPENNEGIGRSHLVKATDLITLLLEQQERQRASLYQRQYTNQGNGADSTMHMYCFYRYKHGSPYAVKKFRRKLWVVELLGKKVIPASN